MDERKGEVTVNGNQVTLLGSLPKIGEKAPNFLLVGNDLQPVISEQFKGKVLVLLSVPSLDTPVCDIETRRFNQEAADLGEDVVILVVSMDLPFAQKRWCGAAGVNRVITASDHRDGSFGLAYGVLIKELRLLARAVFVIDREGIVRYIQLVKEAGKEPDYAAVLEVVRKLS
ncbi:MAG: thiol peroxidase [candidate division WOR-3 bacterium]